MKIESPNEIIKQLECSLVGKMTINDESVNL